MGVSKLFFTQRFLEVDKKSLTATFPSETLLTMLQGSSVPREKEKDDKMWRYLIG